MTDKRTSCRYVPYYCEENVWHLVGDSRFDGGRAEVLFISNPDRSCALWEQRAAQRNDVPVIWDYHVILVDYADVTPQVWDLDTRQAFPVGLREYLRATFRPLPEHLARLAPLFRIIEAKTYRDTFSSDRSHMKTNDGNWLEPPPPWPAIQQVGLEGFWRWTEMKTTDSDLLDLAQLARRYGR